QLPLIFKNTADRFEKIKLGMPISNYLYKNLEDKGIHTLGYGVPLMEYIWTVKKPIKKPSDMKGMRLRVSGKIDSKTVAALGASPVRLPSSETYMALKRGIVDGLLSYPGTVAGRKMEDMLHYCTKAPFGCYGVILMTTQKRWESWPENVRKILSEGGKRYETDFYETCKKVNDAYFETKLKDTEVIMLTENEKKEFQKNMGGIYEWWIDLVGKEGGEEALQIIREQ
ncbi:MAG: TRAP transporter substrate-binding protein DctP, partial [Desulfosarcina sp.]|nr:TRAP transporter substrate-binding protein DctP [Desulfobacterales bacterium]